MVLNTQNTHTLKTNHFSFHNRVKLIEGGQAYFIAMEELISQSKYFIHLQMYIFEDDQTSREIASALIAAANRGIKIWMVLDGFASDPNPVIKKMRSNNIYVHFHNPVFKNRFFHFGRRLHHKLLVVDGQQALISSRNIADRYNDFPGRPAWFDIAACVYGEAAHELALLSCRFIGNNQKKNAIQQSNILTGEETLFLESNHCAVRISGNDWLRKKEQITATYESLINLAEHEILIVCSYFLPGNRIRTLLAEAAKRGVKVKIVQARKSDVRTVKLAERYLYRWMLTHKISVYEYRPSILHAKYGVADNKYMTLGSYNINSISKYACIELNIDVQDETIAGEMATRTRNIIEKDCTLISPQHLPSLFNPVYWLQAVAFLVVKMLIILSTFYIRQRD